MFLKHVHYSSVRPWPQQQRGVVMLISLIMLVAMTLAGIGLMRSIDATNIIAGNLAFKQAATNAADLTMETAINWLTNQTYEDLYANLYASGYRADRTDIGVGQTWDQYWAAISAGVTPISQAGIGGGNTALSIIQRLCDVPGQPTLPANCSGPTNNDEGVSKSGGAGPEQGTIQTEVYFRITTRVTGPRNSVSYTQSLITL